VRRVAEALAGQPRSGTPAASLALSSSVGLTPPPHDWVGNDGKPIYFDSIGGASTDLVPDLQHPDNPVPLLKDQIDRLHIGGSDG
jgi:hypothetical protein